MEAVTEVQPSSDTGGTGGVEQPKPWLEQVEKSLRGHDALREINDVNHLTQTFIKEREGKMKLEGDLKGMIKAPGKDAKPEEISAYRKAIGVPEKPEGYEFPKNGDAENSPEMVAWAQKTFHNLGLSGEQASTMHKEWNSFIAGMVEAENKMAEDEKVENEKKFRAEFKSEEEYKAGYELTKRFWNKVMGTDFDEAYKEAEAWQVPVFMKALFIIAKKTGEDLSPQGAGSSAETKPGMIYNRTPQMKGG